MCGRIGLEPLGVCGRLQQASQPTPVLGGQVLVERPVNVQAATARHDGRGRQAGVLCEGAQCAQPVSLRGVLGFASTYIDVKEKAAGGQHIALGTHLVGAGLARLAVDLARVPDPALLERVDAEVHVMLVGQCQRAGQGRSLGCEHLMAEHRPVAVLRFERDRQRVQAGVRPDGLHEGIYRHATRLE